MWILTRPCDPRNQKTGLRHSYNEIVQKLKSSRKNALIFSLCNITVGSLHDANLWHCVCPVLFHPSFPIPPGKIMYLNSFCHT